MEYETYKTKEMYEPILEEMETFGFSFKKETIDLQIMRIITTYYNNVLKLQPKLLNYYLAILVLSLESKNVLFSFE